MNNPSFAVTSGGGHDFPQHTLSEWNRLFDETSAAVTMHAATRRQEPADSFAQADAETTPGRVRVLCLTQPMTEHQRTAAKRAALDGAVLNRMATEIWAKHRGRHDE